MVKAILGCTNNWINDSKMQNDKRLGVVRFHDLQRQPKAWQLLFLYFSVPFIIFKNNRFYAKKEVGWHESLIVWE